MKLKMPQSRHSAAISAFRWELVKEVREGKKGQLHTAG